MTGRRLTIAALVLALVALLSSLGLYVLRIGGAASLLWVFGTWSALVLAAAVASWRADKGEV